jgi:hypothetical protein
MISHETISAFIEIIVKVATYFHHPLLIFGFFAGITMRVLIYTTVRRQEWFALEFEKRVNRFLETEHNNRSEISFFVTAKKLLERTYYEVFENRAKMRRRKDDKIMNTTDRIFLVRQGVAWLVHDVLKQIRHLKWSNQQPKLLNVTQNSLAKNPCFNNVFGLIPIGRMNDLLNLLPSLFVIGGIFGTFLGVMRGLPELGGMDLSDIEKTKAIMDQFLNEIAFAMSASLLGILFSVITTVVNSVFNPERLYSDVVERLEHSLDIVWNRCDNNLWPEDIQDFNEHRDPTEALAEAAIAIDIAGTRKSRVLDALVKEKAS